MGIAWSDRLKPAVRLSLQYLAREHGLSFCRGHEAFGEMGECSGSARRSVLTGFLIHPRARFVLRQTVQSTPSNNDRCRAII
jgi:hypothetical protein